jgi:integrase
MALTNTQIRNTKPADKPLKLTDGRGLYLEVTPAGGKLWRYRYRLNGKESTLSLGDYPRVGLAAARVERDKVRALVKDGINPALQRLQEKQKQQFDNATTFAAVAEEWRAKQQTKKGWSVTYAHHVQTIISKDLNPRIGNLPIKDIRTPIVYDTVQRVEARGAPTRAILARQIIGGIFKLAIVTHRAVFNPADPLKGEIARRVVEHRKHLERADLPDYLRKLEDYTGHAQTVIALKLLLLAAVRPGELCGASWQEFNLDAAEWRIPAERMKMKRPHFVPLSRQAVELLRTLERLTGGGKYLFPTQGTKSGTMPTATLRNAIKKMGYADKLSPHGCRGTFSTMLNETGFRPDAIERQLAHGREDRVRASYDHAKYLDERRDMMQQWADMLDALQAGGKVLFGQFAKAA